MSVPEASHMTSNALEKSGSLITGASVIRCVFLECLGSSSGPLGLFFLQAICNWGHNSAEFLYESPIECRQPMNTSYFSNIFRFRPLHNRLDFLRISSNPLSGYNKPKECDSISHEHAFLRICVQLLVSQRMTNLPR